MSVNAYTVYSLADGSITIRISCPPELIDPNVPDGCSVVLGDYTNLEYFIDIDAGHVPTLKQPLACVSDKFVIAADGEDFATISNIPAGSTIQWPDLTREVIDGGVAHFGTEIAGTFTVSISSPRHLPQELTIVAAYEDSP